MIQGIKVKTTSLPFCSESKKENKEQIKDLFQILDITKTLRKCFSTVLLLSGIEMFHKKHLTLDGQKTSKNLSQWFISLFTAQILETNTINTIWQALNIVTYFIAKFSFYNYLNLIQIGFPHKGQLVCGSTHTPHQEVCGHA